MAVACAQGALLEGALLDRWSSGQTEFSGKAAEWSAWHFAFQRVAMLSTRTHTEIKDAARRMEPCLCFMTARHAGAIHPPLSHLGDDGEKTFPGEPYRQLVPAHEPKLVTTSMGVSHKVLNPVFS